MTLNKSDDPTGRYHEKSKSGSESRAEEIFGYLLKLAGIPGARTFGGKKSYILRASIF